MSMTTQRNGVLLIAFACLAFGVVVLLDSTPELAEATGSRTMSLNQQMQPYATKNGGTTVDSVVANLTTDVADDYKIEVWIYETAATAGAKEILISEGGAWQHASGSGFLEMAIPVARLSGPGASIRTVWKTFDDQGGLVSTQQQTITVQ